MATSEGKELYFAYGSNMNPARMKVRKAFFTSRVPAKLNGYKLSFTFRSSDEFGSANVTRQTGCIVHGALYTLEKGGLDKLDEFEGVAVDCYARHKVLVEVSDEALEATTYIVTEKSYQEGLKPTQEYVGHLLAGKDILPRDYFEWIESFREDDS